MKRIIFIVLFYSGLATAQTNEEKLVNVMKEFHQALVNKNLESINQHTDKAVSYGHSNGWTQSKTDLIKDFETGFIQYHSFKEDSIKTVINDNIAHVRFVADISATLNGTKANFHLKVLEVWVRKGKRWLLFARQALK